MKRRTILLLVVMAATLLLASGVALAAVINGNGGDNNLTGTNRADRIDGQGGDDTIRALRGSDRLTGGPDDDTLNGGRGNDTYVFTDGWGVDNLSADAGGRDTLDFSALTSSVQVILTPTAANEAASGTSTLNFPSTVVIEDVKGGSNGDGISGNDANNLLFGYGGSDEVIGAGGSDALFGGPLHDFVSGGNDDDTLNGGEGDDFYTFDDGWGEDTIPADASGSDLLDFFGLSSPVTINLEASGLRNEAQSGTDTLNFPSVVVVEVARGGGAGDAINGNASGNKLWGRGGGDTINGGLGADTVYGEDPFNTPNMTGDDTIDVADRDAGDSVDCGPGTDTVEVDVDTIILLDGSTRTFRLDPQISNCETINEVETP